MAPGQEVSIFKHGLAVHSRGVFGELIFRAGFVSVLLLRVTLYPWMSPFWVSGGGVLQVTSRLEGDAADTLMD